MFRLECVFLFFKQKTAYEMRISDWSSDVCSSDLPGLRLRHRPRAADADAGSGAAARGDRRGAADGAILPALAPQRRGRCALPADRKSVVSGKSVSVRVDLGGRRIIKTQHNESDQRTQQCVIKERVLTALKT